MGDRLWVNHLGITSHLGQLVSVILDIRKTVEIILVCLTTAARVISNWRLTNILTN